MRTLLLLALALLATRAAVAPVAIDIGTSWLRLAHYNPGSVEGIDVVVSDQGDRRFASVIGFSQGEPVFGDEADSLSQRRPERTVPQLPRLVSFHHGGVVRQGYSADFPRAPLVGLERGDIGAEAGWDHAPSIPELMALVLRYGLAQARAQLNLSVSATDSVPVVLVSPMKAVQPYQLMMVQIAEAAGAYVRNTISTAAAAGIDWAERRLKPTEEQYVIIADIGTLGSSATLLHAVRTRSGHLTLKVIVHAEDDSLGGFRIDQALVKFLKKKVEERRAVVDWSPKREARMLVAARELKEQLSASPQAEVFIEELLPEWDFKLAVTRDEADDACKELYAAFEKTNPVQRLRDDGHLKGITVQNIEVIGGASRIPKVIAALTASGEGIVVARHLSADESVVWGAAEYGRLLTDNMIDLKEPVPPPFYPDSVRPLPEEDVAKLRHVMKAHQEREARKQRKAEARNKLETMLIAAREDTDLSEEASEALRAASNWLDDTVETTSLEDFEVKTNEVQAVLKKERSRRGLKEEL